MTHRVDPRNHNNFLDANFWDESGIPSDDSAILDILELERQGDINLILPWSVRAEIEHPRTPIEIKRQALNFIYTVPAQLTHNEIAKRSKILVLIQGNAKPGKHHRDVLHLFEAEKHGGGYFITKDERLLKKARQLQNLFLTLGVVSPTDFLKCFHSSGE